MAELRLHRLIVVVAAGVLAAGCGDSGSDESAATSDEFCAAAGATMSGQQTISVLEFSPQFFADMDAEFATMDELAPGSLRDDIAVLRDGFELTGEIYEEFGFQNRDPAFVDALVERLPTDAMTEARATIDAGLDEGCDPEILRIARAPGGYSFDRSDRDGGVANIMAAFATDQPTAECIWQAWGDVSQVAPEDLTPELFTFRICGTSIFELISGDPRLTGRDIDVPSSG